jgi:ribosomal protein L34
MGNVDRRPRTADGSRTGFPACEEERTVNEGGIETADRGRQTAVGRAFQPVGKRTVNEWGTNKRMKTTDGRPAVGRAFQPVRKSRPSTNGERINEYGRQTAEWTAAGEAFQPVREQTVNEWGTNKRIWTADRGRRTP